MQNKHMNNNQGQGFQNNPYINQSQNMQSQGINTMNTAMQTNPQAAQQNPYYNTNPINTQTNPQATTMDSLLGSFDTTNFLKGALIGAVGAYLLTNENAQKTIFKTFAKGADMFGAGIEELKERMEDAKAELEAEQESK
ncbi:MAG: YtxH domain-containing protein [Arcobacteraceae bacterium]|nr:YtxH domain-containing protein [Arcobacteraceae bacterium]